MNVQVQVHNGDVAGSLKKFSKRVIASGLMREARQRMHRIPPSQARRLKQKQARKKVLKKRNAAMEWNDER